MIRIVKPRNDADIDAIRQLCWDYRTHLISIGGLQAEIIQAFYPQDKYETLMQSLPQVHAEPTGGMRLALRDEMPVGCGMFHEFEPGTAEIKRLFVSDEARGTGAGRALMEHLIDDCRAAGHQRILLDTAKSLTNAAALYDSLGFARRGPYQDIPELARDHLLFFELTL